MLKLQRQGNIFQHATPGHQVGLLEHKTDLAARPVKLFPVQQHVPFGGHQQASQDTQQGALAAARRAENAHEFLRPHREGDFREHM